MLIVGYSLNDFGVTGMNHVNFTLEHCNRGDRCGLAVMSIALDDAGAPKFRHMLVWQWDTAKPILFAIMLNPSKAGAFVDDMTITKLLEFARRHGYGGIAVANLSDYRCTDQAEWKRAGKPHTGHCGIILREFLQRPVPEGQTRDILLAWGNGGPPLLGWLRGRKRADRVRFFTLGLNRGGQPEHPCRLPYDRRLEEVTDVD